MNKFLILGAVAIGLISNSALAANNNNEEFKNTLAQIIHNLIQEQHNNGYLKEKASIKVKFIPSNKNTNYEMPENVTQIVANQCKIILAFDQNGYAPILSTEKSIIEVTEFKNEKQKEMMREFIILHESFHCEFANIENPIQIEGKSLDFNKKINYYLKEMNTIPIENIGHLGYIDTLAENFSDIAAIAILGKKYGQEDKDLQYVFNAIKVQRHAEYFNYSFDSHFTHIGVEKALNRDNLDKLINSQNGNELKDIVLELANKSVQQLMTQRKEMTDGMFSENAFNVGIMTSLMRYVNYHVATNKQKNMYTLDNDWKDHVTRGFNAQFARGILKPEEIKQLELDFFVPGVVNEKAKKTISLVNDLAKEPQVKQMMNDKFKDFSMYMKEFKSIIYKQNQDTVSKFDMDNKETVEKKILNLKTKFLNSVNESQNNLKL